MKDALIEIFLVKFIFKPMNKIILNILKFVSFIIKNVNSCE